MCEKCSKDKEDLKDCGENYSADSGSQTEKIGSAEFYFRDVIHIGFIFKVKKKAWKTSQFSLPCLPIKNIHEIYSKSSGNIMYFL